MPLQIGHHGWVAELNAMTEPLGCDFWSAFAPCTRDDLRELRQLLQRPLPSDFEEFYLTVGFGEFPYLGGFMSPRDIADSLSTAIYYVLGSLCPTQEWCSEEGHRRLWLSRGADNPLPQRFTEQALSLGGLKLYDLLCFGSWGGAGLHFLHLPPEPTDVVYCAIDCEFDLGDEASSFSMAIEDIVDRFLEVHDD